MPCPECHTSVGVRVEHVKAEGRTSDLEAAKQGSVTGSGAAAGLEETIWLWPIEDRLALNSSREGLVEGFSLGRYLMLVDQAVISSQPLQVVRSLDPASHTHPIPPARPAALN
jgi:hypothetical protein